MEDVGDDEEDDKITADDADVRDDALQVRTAHCTHSPAH